MPLGADVHGNHPAYTERIMKEAEQIFKDYRPITPEDAAPVITNIKKTYRDNLISIYPNPNNGIFKLRLGKVMENSEIKIINSIGQELHTQSINTETTTIVTKSLSEGIYTLLLTQNKELAKSIKFFVKN